MSSQGMLGKFLIWRVRHIKQQQFILMLSFVVGVLSGLAAVVLKNTVYYTHYFLTKGFTVDSKSYWYLAYPMFGILLTLLFVNYVVKDQIGHGVSRILYAISKRNSIIKPHNTYTSIVASTFTIGFGGSVGAEAPIVLTGASIGSNIGRLFRMNYRTITLLLGCGAAGAIAGIFKAPIAGIVFTLEVLMLDLTLSSIVPLLISTVSAATVSYFLMGNEVMLSYTIQHPFLIKNIPYFIILGIFCGFVSLYFTKASMYIELKFGEMKNIYVKWLMGGVILSLLIFIFPPLYGEGYVTLKALLTGYTVEIVENSFFYFFKDNSYLLLGYLFFILAFKAFATASTTGSGGIGGIFAPSLFLGGISGFFIARVLKTFSFVHVSESNFALVGMGGMMAGVMHAPLTAIFLIVEITGGYGLLIPLIITSTISFLTIVYFEPHSIYTKRLAKRGELITHDKDKAVLTLMELGKIIETDFIPVGPDDTLGHLIKAIAKSHRNIFPVVDKNGALIGVVLLNDIRDVMFNTEMYETTYVRDLLVLPPTYLSSTEPMSSVMKKFDDTGAWNLPVIDDGKYVGYISKSKIFSAYRNILVQFSNR